MATTFTSNEYPCYKSLSTLISKWDSLALTPDQRKPIKYQGKEYPLLPLLKKYKKAYKDGKVPINYEYSAKHAIPGRQFSKGTPSLQGLKRWIRHTLSTGYHDYDMVNCHPTIFTQYCEKKGWDVIQFKSYLENRDTYLAELMTKNDIGRDDAKEIVLALLNGGNKNYDSVEDKPVWLINLRNAISTIHEKILTEAENKDLVKKVRENKKRNIGGSVMNNILCNIENDILMKAIEFLNVEEPVLIFDGFQSKIQYTSDQLLNLQEHVLRNTGYDVKWIEKSMDEGIDLSPYQVDEDLEEEKEEEMDDYEAAEIFLKWSGEHNIEMVCVSNEVLWYNPENEIWMTDFKRIKVFINKCAVLDKKYRGTDRCQNALLSQLYNLVPVNDDWYTNIKPHQQGYLPLKTKIWDFKNKTLLDYESKYGFFYKLSVDYIPDVDTTEVEQYFFKELFHHEDIKYLQCMLSRALAGHGDKNLIFFIGDGNSGKGFFEAGISTLLGKLFGTILAGNLVHKRNIGDEAKHLSWLVKIKDCHIVMGQEIKMEEDISGGLIKKFASGGDKQQGRTNGKDEIEFIYKALTILCANDLPKIQGLDDGFKNRVIYVEMEKVFLPANAEYKGVKERVLIRPELKDVWIKKPEVIQALLKLLLDNYSENKPDVPEHLQMTASEWNEDGGDDLNVQISELFQHTYKTIKVEDEDVIVKEHGEPVPLLGIDGKEFFVPSQVLFKKCKSKNIQVSMKKMGAIMRSLGFPSKQKKLKGKNAQVYYNIKLAGTQDEDY